MRVKTVIGVTAAFAALSALVLAIHGKCKHTSVKEEVPETPEQDEGEAMDPVVPEAKTEPTPQGTDPEDSDSETSKSESHIVDMFEPDPPLTSEPKADTKEQPEVTAETTV